MKLTWKQRIIGEIPDPPKPQEPPPQRVTVGSFNGMTLRDWVESDPHIQFARGLMRESKFRDMLAVLSNARPRPMLKGTTDTEAAIALGIREGYDQLFGLILQLAELPPRPSDEVPITYGAENFNLNRAQ